MLRSESSDRSQGESVLTFGPGEQGLGEQGLGEQVGEQEQADAAEVRRPSGAFDKLSNLSAGRRVAIEAGQGVVAAGPHRDRRVFAKPWQNRGLRLCPQASPDKISLEMVHQTAVAILVRVREGSRRREYS
jgi:hypothetical protein